MFAFSKTGYGADGTGLHMHYNDKGGTRATPNVDSIEQKLGQLTKHFGGNNQGIIGEIEGLLKQVRLVPIVIPKMVALPVSEGESNDYGFRPS